MILHFNGLTRGDNERGGAVTDTRGVTSVNGTTLFENWGEFVQLLKSGFWLYMGTIQILDI